MLDSATHRINQYPTEISYGIRWIEISLMDSAIQRLNNQGLVFSSVVWQQHYKRPYDTTTGPQQECQKNQ